MKLYINILSIFCMLYTNNSSAFAIIKSRIIENPGFIHSTNMKVGEFVKLSAKDFSLITGKKMNLWNRLSFSLLKMRMKHELKKNPDLNMNDYYTKKNNHRISGWWFVGAGAVLLIVLIIAGLSVAGPGL